jgi:hypothetical protein
MRSVLNRPLWNVAHDIAAALSRRRPASRAPIELPQGEWDDCARSIARYRLALSRGWFAAAAAVEQEFHDSLLFLERRLKYLQSDLPAPPPPPPPPQPGRDRSASLPGVVYRELLALGDEFDDHQLDRSSGVLSVTTPPITLDDVALGRFEIRLDWRSVSPQPFRIIPCDPGLGASSGGHCHPHVSGDWLCAGAGTDSLARALAEGRLCECFQIIRAILATYNPDSAYVRLKDWNGTPCTDCGSIVTEDDLSRCSGCEDDLCSECGWICQRCRDLVCGECRSTCTGCDDILCGDCADTCNGCQEPCCARCLQEGECPGCRENQADETDAEGVDTVAPGPAVHAVCLGEARIPA